MKSGKSTVPSFSETELKVLQWGEARGIVQNGKPVGQASKTIEESAELLVATAKLQVLRDVSKMRTTEEFAAYKDAVIAEAKDAIGDTMVTLVMAAATMDVDLRDCFNLAYQEIKERKGYLRADGVFVKES